MALHVLVAMETNRLGTGEEITKWRQSKLHVFFFADSLNGRICDK